MNPFLELEAHIFSCLTSLFKAINENPKIEVGKDCDHYRMNIEVDGNEHYISINGKGIDKKEYYPELVNILKEYLDNNYN